MIRPKHPSLSVRKQCELIELNRANVYRDRAAVTSDELELMRRMDELHMKWPFMGSRKIARGLSTEKQRINRKCVQRLMRKMGIKALYCKPKTSVRNPEHKVYPYLLKDIVVTQTNQVWATDITYIPMQKGFCYLVAIIDWYSRKVLSWRLSNSLDTSFCLEAFNEAIDKHCAPEIFNTDQGCQFTSKPWTDALKEQGIAISMDGRGRYLDNIFIERLWRSVKYEEVYLHAYGDMREAHASLTKYFHFYNQQRMHQSLDYKTPDAIYYPSHKEMAMKQAA